MKVLISQIKILRQHLRRDIDAEQLRFLAEDMARPHGQLQPIAIRPLDDNTYELIAGRRRLEAARLLGWAEIEAHLISYDGLAEIPALAENIKRSQLTPLEEADVVGYMHVEQQLSIGDIAERTGHGTSWVQDRLALSRYPDNFKLAVHRRRLSIGAAGLMLQITDTEYRDYLLHIAETNGATIHQAQAWVLDWTARQKMLGRDGWAGPIPQPPPPTSPQRQPCFFCDEQLEAELVILIRVCRGCYSEAVNAKRNAEPTTGADPAEGRQVDLLRPGSQDQEPAHHPLD